MPNIRIGEIDTTDSIVHMPPRLSQRHCVLNNTTLDHMVTFPVGFCPRKFNRYGDLRKHQNTKHSGRRSPGEDEYSASRDDPNLPHKCEKCGSSPDTVVSRNMCTRPIAVSRTRSCHATTLTYISDAESAGNSNESRT